MERSREAWVGAFVVGGIALFAAGLFMIGDRRLLFTDHFEVSTTFAKVTGLEVGTRVRLAGLDAGEVLEIRVPPGPLPARRAEAEGPPAAGAAPAQTR